MIISRDRLGLLLGVITMVVFAGTLPATRLGLTGFDALFLTVARGTVAGLAGVTVLLLTRPRIPTRAQFVQIALIGLCLVGGFSLFTALGMMTVPPSHGGVILGIVPLGVAAGGAVLLGERPSLGFWVASVVGAILVLAFVMRQNGTISLGFGDLFLFGAVIAGSTGYALSGRLAGQIPGWQVITWVVVICLPVTATLTALLWPDNISSVAMPAWLGLIYVGLLSQYLSFFAFNAGMAMSGVARVGQILLLQPFVTAAMAVPVNGETLDFETLLFAAAVVATVAIGQRMRVGR